MIDHIQIGAITVAVLLLFVPHFYAMWATIGLLAFAAGIEVCRVVS